uniref:Transthyretin-like family protein n=1 Tax=Gongylonema pulchrum TaxID=637853 RepID=A0A183DTH9_9BILA
LASRDTNADGYYELLGGIESGSKADIVLKIYHRCDFNQFPCRRKVTLGIPNQYLTERIDIKRWFEAGTLNMQLQFPREKKRSLDEALASRDTDADGYYELLGGIESEKMLQPCRRKVTLDIPNQYLTERIEIKRWFEAGTLNMQLQFPREKKRCDYTG